MGKRICVVCVMGADGNTLETAKYPNTRSSRREYLRF